MLSWSRKLATRLAPAEVLKISSRNTVIVKRVHKPPLVKWDNGTGQQQVPQRIIDKSVINTEDCKYMVYECEEEKQEQKLVKLILLRNVDDYGVTGQIIEEKSLAANRDLLLPGFAVYHNEENLLKYADIIIPEEIKMVSSDTAHRAIKKWSKRVLDICLNMHNEWTIDKWHIKASLRKCKVWINEDQIEIPGGTISGPNLDLENKEFIAIITINNFDKVKIRCRIHHFTKIAHERINLKSWYFYPAEPVWEHERQELLDMNRLKPSRKLREDVKLKSLNQQYQQWKREREERISAETLYNKN